MFKNFVGCGDEDGLYPVANRTYRKTTLSDSEALVVFDEKNFNQRVYDEILEKYEFE